MKRRGNLKNYIILLIILIPGLLVISYITKAKQIETYNEEKKILETNSCIGFIERCKENQENCMPQCKGIAYNYRCYKLNQHNERVRVPC